MPMKKKPEPARKAKPAAKKAAPKAAPAPVKWRVAAPAAPVESTPAAPSLPPAPVAPRELTPKESRFVEEYLVDLNSTQAYMRSHAGVKTTSASTEGSRLLANPLIQSAIAEGRAELSRRTGITAERALAEAWAVATADARELIEYLVGCCRYCYGDGFKWQRSLAEFNHDREKHLLSESTEPFDEKGGIGFDPRLDPHPHCPECFGKGAGRAHINDTRKLSPAAAALYGGVKLTKEGMEVKMHSKLDALEKVFKHLGLYEKDNTQKVDPIATLLATIAKSSIPVVKAAPSDE